MSEINRVVISSGHSLKVRGASGVLDEVDEARKVVEQVADELGSMGLDVVVFHDDTSTTQSENLATIVDFHNEQERDLDVSVHFNAYVETTAAMGTECLFLSQAELAAQVAASIAAVGFKNRGAKKRTDLYFLNKTDMPAILIEVCFVDSQADADLYNERFERVCYSIASAIAGEETDVRPQPEPPAQPDAVPVLEARGKVSWFGGPKDTAGVSPSEGLAFIYNEDDTAPWLFLPNQPPNTTGLARRLDPNVPYIAMRWDYEVYSKEQLASMDFVALVTAPKTGRSFTAWPADWGPHVDTGRIADISPGLMQALGIQTDDEVEVVFPFRTQEGIA